TSQMDAAFDFRGAAACDLCRVQTAPQIDLKTPSPRVAQAYPKVEPTDPKVSMTPSGNGFIASHASVQRISLQRICATKENVMSATSTTRRDVLATSAAAGAFSLIADQMPQAAEGNIAIRAFHNINVPETALVDLRRRIAATQWPERKTSEPRSD